MQLKIGDFGLATKLEFEGDRKRTICGTPNYIAPEILDGKQGHSYEVDIWSFGVILYTLIIGKPPFETNDVKATYKRIKTNAYSFPDRAQISDSARDLISRILNLDPGKRPTLDELYEHPFINNGYSIPKLLPPSTLACPPSSSYMKQFLTSNPNVDTYVFQKPRMESTVPIKSTDFTKEVKPLNTGVDKALEPIGPIGSARVVKNENDSKIDLTSSVWVKKWVDYSSKYGLGYIMSNGTYGVYFNDSTKIIFKNKER